VQPATVLELITEAKRRGTAIVMICYDRDVRGAGADRLIDLQRPRRTA
jgi:alpha-D-ribose 1-methylphosphonate 5-triphosphate synthase subunit PhnL